MPDITMCTGEGCPLRKTCYRYTATPTPRRQAYFAAPTVEVIDGHAHCVYYSDMRKHGDQT
jgi:hypothetical protein